MNGRDDRFRRPAPPRAPGPLDGVLLVDKPSGPTSHDVVAGIRRKFRIPKVGHGGALDPMATGLLVILLGKGTKLANGFTGADKAYEGTMHLGIATDSQDAHGKVVAEAEISGVTQAALGAEIKKLTGDIFQTPPMVSAVKVDGVPLYKHARKGKVVEREPRLIHVYGFALTRFAPPLAEFVLACTKGTYVRTLCADIGDALGCGAHLARLCRTRCGQLRLQDALPYCDLLDLTSDELRGRVIHVRSFTGGGPQQPQ